MTSQANPLCTRPDDHEETVLARLDVYREQTIPLVEYYEQAQAQGLTRYRRINADASMEVVRQEVEDAVRLAAPKGV